MPHESHEELAKRIQKAETKVTIGGEYYHWRNPKQHYKVTGVGINEATNELVVIYELLVKPTPVTWVRRLEGEDGWLTPVFQEGNEVARFQQANEQ